VRQGGNELGHGCRREELAQADAVCACEARRRDAPSLLDLVDQSLWHHRAIHGMRIQRATGEVNERDGSSLGAEASFRSHRTAFPARAGEIG